MTCISYLILCLALPVGLHYMILLQLHFFCNNRRSTQINLHSATTMRHAKRSHAKVCLLVHWPLSWQGLKSSKRGGPEGIRMDMNKRWQSFAQCCTILHWHTYVLFCFAKLAMQPGTRPYFGFMVLNYFEFRIYEREILHFAWDISKPRRQIACQVSPGLVACPQVQSRPTAMWFESRCSECDVSRTTAAAIGFTLSRTFLRFGMKWQIPKWSTKKWLFFFDAASHSIFFDVHCVPKKSQGLNTISLIWLQTNGTGFPLFSTAKGRRFPRWLKGTRPSEISTRSGCRSFIAWQGHLTSRLNSLFNELPTDRSFMVLPCFQWPVASSLSR